MPVDFHAEPLELFLERECGGLSVEAGEDDGADVETYTAERVDETQNVGVVSDAEVSSYLILLDVERVDDDNDLGLVAQLQEHLEFTVRLESGEYA